MNAAVIVEVLPDSTEAYDRGAKAALYRRIPSLREYVLVNQHERRIEAFHRNERGLWELSEAGPGERIALPSLDGTLAVDAVYADPLSESQSMPSSLEIAAGLTRAAFAPFVAA